ncbi:MAG TPA: TetR/AcrR family transcriptional regulator [Terriglobales bacterium]|nr:TetR/AcrR family transcriptional regulator [Terriglobales bacterium]
MRQLGNAGYKPASNGTQVRRTPGRPRSEHARRAILRSTLRLLQKTGFPELGIEAIAAYANVSKATVYRWWPNKAALVADAFFSITDEKLRFPDTGSVCADMNLQMKQLVRILRGKEGRTVAALIGGGQSDPELIDAFRNRFMKPRRQEAYETLRRGMRRGELPTDLNMDLLLDTLYGAIYFRFLIRHASLSEAFINDLCKIVVGAVMIHERPKPAS